MSCCPNDIISFTAVDTTTIPYTGLTPLVSVWYLQPDNTYQEAGVFTQIQVTATDIIIDHGGTATGYVKIL